MFSCALRVMTEYTKNGTKKQTRPTYKKSKTMELRLSIEMHYPIVFQFY